MIRDNRIFERHQVRRKGKLLFVEHPCCIDCSIKDISEGGALVTTQVFLPLLHKLLLWDESARSWSECDVSWRRGRMVGMYFTDIRGRAKRRELLGNCFVKLSTRTGFPPTMH